MNRKSISSLFNPSFSSYQQSGHLQQSDNTHQLYDFQWQDKLQSRVPPFQHQTIPSIPSSASSQYPFQTQQAPYSSAIASFSDHYVRSVYPRLTQSSLPSQFIGTSSGRPQHFLYEPTGRFHSAAALQPPLIQSLGHHLHRSHTPAPAVAPNSETPARLLRQHLVRIHKVAMTDDLVRTTKRSNDS